MTVTVSALPISIINLEVKTCPGTAYEYQGASLAVGETRSFILKNWQNCDSIVNVKVTALPVSASAFSVQICPGTTYTYGSVDLPVGAIQDFTLKNWLGCDSIVTVTVSALPISIINLEVKTCPGTTYEYQGASLTVGETRSFFPQELAELRLHRQRKDHRIARFGVCATGENLSRNDLCLWFCEPSGGRRAGFYTQKLVGLRFDCDRHGVRTADVNR